MKNVARLIDEKARDRKSSSGTSGCGRVAIRIGKAIRETTPIAIAIQAAVSVHSLACPRMTPNARPPTASAATSAPSQSNRPVDSVSRDSCTCVRVAHRAKASSGTLIEEGDPPAERVDQAAADDRPEDGQRGRRRRPDPERPAALGAVEGMGDEGQRSRDEQGPGGALGEAEDDQPLERRRQPAQRGRRGEADQPDRVDPPPPVVVGQRAGQDQQRGEDRQVAADDVGLALEDADQGRRQVLADVLERGVDDGRIEEDRTRADDGADEGPALARGHVVGSVAAVPGFGQGPARLSAMPGPVALIGAGEFLPAMADVDAGLLLATGRARPRVAILPTASYPDGEEVFSHWAAMGVAHFAGAGRRGRAGARPRSCRGR